MKRKYLIVLLVLTLAIVSAFALAACGETDKPDGGNGDNGNSTVVTPDIPQIEVKVYIDGEYASTGVDATNVESGKTYMFKAAK